MRVEDYRRKTRIERDEEEVGLPFVSITRLRVRAWRFLPEFLWRAFASRRQAQRSTGFVQGVVTTAPGRAFWTATVWSDEASMRRFRDTAAHKATMPRLLDMCDEAAVAQWMQDDDRLPEPAEMLERVRSIGRLSKVRHPSPGHTTGSTVPDGQPPRATPPFRPR